jgi:4-hydroxy-tetrahydrodipicolinate reductase
MIEDKLKVSLFGVGGRMGGEVIAILNSEPDIELVNLIERPGHPAVGTSVYGITVSCEPRNLPLAGTVFCDFTNASSAVENADLSAQFLCSMLIGATGFDEAQKRHLAKLSEKIPLMIAPNLSLGVNLFFYLVEQIAKTVGDSFQAELIEAHHKGKKDAPSGTAKEILRILQSQGGFSEVKAHSLRIGDIPGEHRLFLSAEGELLEISHSARNRRAFAKGVPLALRFLAKIHEPGFYSFRQALGF